MSKSKKSISLALMIILIILIFGTIFYHYVENWRWIDAFYFTTITLTTIGYGDFSPTHDISKILTSIFALSAIPLILFAFSVVAENYFEKRMENIVSRESKREIKELQRIESESLEQNKSQKKFE